MYLIKRYRVYALLVAAVILASACSEESKTTPAEQKLPSLNNELDDGKYSVSSNIEGENVGVTMTYWTDYNAKSWRITDGKTLRFSVKLDRAPEGPVKPIQVFIEHVHVDVSVQASKASIDGMPQDSMDDSLHSGDQPGFLVTTQYPYEEVFSIEGYSKTLIDGWSHATSEYGSDGAIGEKRLTEGALRNQGANANKFTFVYDVVIGNKEDGFHKRIIVNEFKVPLGSL